MSKKNRAALRRSLLTLSLVLVVAFAAVGGTLAWLTADTTVVTNTFTLGKVTITLDESDYDKYGEVIETTTRVKANDYKLLPGQLYQKDPVVHVAKESEPCYLFVKIDNQLAAIEDATTIHDQMISEKFGWEVLDAVKYPGVYYYKDIVDAREAAKDVPVFETVKIQGGLDNNAISSYDNKTIVIDAFAVQADNTESAAKAWELVWGTNTPDWGN